MRSILLLIFVLFFQLKDNGQDFIYKTDSTIQEGKILEITVDKIKYKKAEVKNGPTYEILKSDVIKIKYKNGYNEIINPKINEKIIETNHKQSYDTSTCSIIYILFNYGQDLSQKFPIYMNGDYILTIKNHTRVVYKRYTKGYTSFERRGINTYKNGPITEFFIEPDKSYGIRINEPYPWGLDPNKRFTLDVIKDSVELNSFLKKEFYGFKPFKEDNITIEEPKIKK
jgi:hypothetical protein